MVPESQVHLPGHGNFCFEGDNSGAHPTSISPSLPSAKLVQIGPEQGGRNQGRLCRADAQTPIPFTTGIHKDHLKVHQEWVSLLLNLQPVARNGMHHYKTRPFDDDRPCSRSVISRGAVAIRWEVNPPTRYHEDSSPKRHETFKVAFRVKRSRPGRGRCFKRRTGE